MGGDTDDVVLDGAARVGVEEGLWSLGVGGVEVILSSVLFAQMERLLMLCFFLLSFPLDESSYSQCPKIHQVSIKRDGNPDGIL